MTLRICHAADIHIRPLQYLDEMAFTIDRFIESIQEKKPDITLFVGDTFHSKLTVSSEYFDLCYDFFKRVGDICPLIITLGNHDFAVNNTNRLDAVSPIVRAVQGKTKNEVVLLKGKKGYFHQEFYFHNFCITEKKEDWPSRKDLEEVWYKDKINCALYHGCIENSILDNDWISRGNRDDKSLFDGFDFAFLGDIHKQQFIEPHIAYPGSLRQNSFGEDLDKGYLFWEINSKDDFKAEYIILPQKRYFYTIEVDTVNNIPKNLDLKKNSRIRVQLKNNLNPLEELKVKSTISKIYEPINDIQVIYPKNNEQDVVVSLSDGTILDENIRNPEIQKKLIYEYFSEKMLQKKDFEELYKLDKKYNSYIDTDVLRNVVWEVDKFEWSNLFSYGEDNSIDFSKARGIVGIFGKNGIGKTSTIDAFCYGPFASSTKPKALNFIDYINNNKRKAKSKHTINCDNKKYVIERSSEAKETKKGDFNVKNNVDFYILDDNEKISKNGEKTIDTNKEIEKVFGSLDDFITLSLIRQFGMVEFIEAGATDRKKKLAKFFDLEIFEEKYKMAVEDYKKIKKELEDYNNFDYDVKIETIKSAIKETKSKIKFFKEEKEEKNQLLEVVNEAISKKKQKLCEIENENSFYDLDNKILSKKEEFDKIENLLFVEQNKHNELISIIKNENKENLEELIRKNNDIENSIEKLYHSIKIDEKKKSLIKKIPNEFVCKKCPLAQEAYEAEARLILLDKEFITIQSEIMTAPKKDEIIRKINAFDDLQNCELKIENLKLKLENHSNEFSLLKEKKKTYEKNKSAIENNRKILEEIEKYKISQNKIREQVNDIENELFSSIKNFGRFEEQLEETTKEKSKFEELMTKSYYYQLYLEAMGKNGIGYMIMSKKLPRVQKELNKILGQIASFKILFEDDVDNKSVKLYMVDSKKGKRIVESISGAEKTITAIALRTALWKVSSLPKSNILILDEPFGFLDGNNFDGIINLLQHLKNYYKTIIVITHSEEIKGIMDYSLYVRERDGFAKLN